MKIQIVLMILLGVFAAGALANPLKVTLEGQWGPMIEEAPARPLTDGGDAAIRVRQAHMRSVSAQFRSIEALALAGLGDTDLAMAAGRNLVELAQRTALVFHQRVPRRAAFGAKTALWDEPVEFAEHVNGFVDAARTMMASMEARRFERLGADLTAVRYQCLACHHHYAAWENRPGVEGRRAPTSR